MTRWAPIDVTRQLPTLRRYARALTRDASAADDLVQQTLLRAYERSDTFRVGASLVPWLIAILHNQFLTNTRRSRVESHALAHLAHRADAAIGGGQEDATLLRQIADRFAALPEGQRAVLHLIAIEGLSYKDAAEALSVPVGTIMSRLSRARAALRDDAAPAAQHPPLRLVGGTDAD